jgi:hypothetical protein
MADYIPGSDADFNIWQAAIIEAVVKNATLWGIPAADLTALQEKQSTWTTAFGKASSLKNRNSGDVQAKDDARKDYEKDLRKFVAQWLANNTKVSNGERERMGLTVRDNTRTPIGVPVSKPVGNIDFSVRLQHIVHFSNDIPGSKAKPHGVHGCEIWIKKGGEAPKDPSELTFLATSTRTPYTVMFEGADVGKTIWYWLRWVNTKGERGPWGSPVSAMVVG